MAVTMLVLAAGLSTRIWGDRLPPFVASHFGDALWAAMIYCGLRAIGTRKRMGWALLLSLLFCLGIETTQLYQAEWMNQIRNTVLGGLVLGRGFLTVDLVRYTAGIVVFYGLDVFLDNIRRKRSEGQRG
ncbi:DUF2809 domain-containing protein [Paenibacillus sp. GCM10027627]